MKTNVGSTKAFVVVGVMATLLSSSPVASQWMVGDRVCVEGYLMDYECIRLGTLIDNPNVMTLSAQGPLVHSVHCLIDVPQCIAAPYEILLPSLNSSMMSDDDAFIRGWRLDDDTKARAVNVAKTWGICDDCNMSTGTIERGLHVGITGEIVNLGDGAGTPPTIRAVDDWTVLQVSDPATWTSLVCPAADGGSDRPPTPPPEPMVGDSFCVEGYVMDLFCINRGTLFDNPNVTTLSLEGPPIHSVHCLLDVMDCVTSAFEILIPPLPTTPDLYQRGWRLDDASKAIIVALAQSVGICENCTDMGMSGTIERGLYVSLTATMQDVGSADSPPIITATDITAGNATGVPKCAFITRPPPAPTGAPTGAPTAAPLVDAPAPAPAPTAPAPGGDNLTIEEGLTLQSVDNGDNTATFTLLYSGEGWVALGISPTGQMVGSLAVIGLADGADPVIYNLTLQELSGIVPVDANQQILTSSSFTQQDGISTLMFTVPLDTTETSFSVSSSAENRYIYAYGTSNELGYHAARGDFSASLNGEPSDAGGPKVGDEFCVEGYLMDEFCIKLGTLVDNPNVTTLSPEGPPIHSIHCMLDVADCIASPFELVVKPQNGETMFQRGWRLDDDAKEMAVALAKQVGKCDVCSGSQVNNFYLSMTAILQDLGTADRPPLISVKDMDIVAGDPVQTCSVITNPPWAPAPVDTAPAPAPGGVLTLEPGLTLAILDNGNNTASYTLLYEGEGWIGFGVSTDGAMIGSQAVIGLPGAGDPVIYNLASKDSAGVVPAESDQQILTSSSVTQEDGVTTLTFTVPLESDAPFSVSASGDTGYVYAYGSSNELGYHAARGAVSASLQIAGDSGGEDEQAVPSGIISLEDGFTQQSVDNGDNTATFTLVYDGEGWIGYGVSPSGQMVGSQTVLGLPDSGEAPQLYDLNSQTVAGVVPAPSDQQILTSSSVTQEGGVTTLIFTVPLDASGPFSIATTGETGYIYAYGTSNELGYHAARGAFSASIQGEANVVDESGKYKAHGWIMSLAWGIFVPLAIGASMLRDLCPGPPGTFFMIHRALNTTAIVLVIIGFALAVSAVEAEGLSHFSQNKHRTTGIVIFVFSLAQGLNGYLRPHLPHTPDTDADANKADAAVDNAEEGENLVTEKADKPPTEEKSGARKIWEIGHRLLGFGLLATSWWNCVTGIQYFNFKFSDIANPNSVNIFLGVTLGLSGVIFFIYAGRKVLKKSQ